MDTKTRNKYSTFLEEDWARLGYLATPGANEYGLGLTNTKHPIFQYTNIARPSTSQPIWLQYSLDNYELLCAEIDPILRLATLMLESTPSLDFLHDVIFNPRIDPIKIIEYNGCPVLEIEPSESNEAKRDMTKEALKKLAESIVFLVETPKDDPEKDSHCNTAPSLSIQPYGINIMDESKSPKGIGSSIRINKIYLILSLQFKVATLICHEIAHAVGYASNQGLLLDFMMESTLQNLAKMESTKRVKERVGTNEPFYGDDTVAELGYCWETAVLGGTVQWAHQVEHPLFFSEWPSFLTDGDYPRRAGYKQVATQYVVPMHYLRNLHREEFWKDIREADATALYIKKMYGIRVTDQDTPVFDAPGFTAATSDDDSTVTPESFRLARDDEEDPSASRANETLSERVERIAENRKSLRQGKLHIANQVNASGKKMPQKARKD